MSNSKVARNITLIKNLKLDKIVLKYLTTAVYLSRLSVQFTVFVNLFNGTVSEMKL